VRRDPPSAVGAAHGAGDDRGADAVGRARPAAARLPDEAPLLHYAERQDVVVWWPERV
jgi:hypothetical protein